MATALGIFNVFLGGTLFGMAAIILARQERPLFTTLAFAPICTTVGVISIAGVLA